MRLLSFIIRMLRKEKNNNVYSVIIMIQQYFLFSFKIKYVGVGCNNNNQS